MIPQTNPDNLLDSVQITEKKKEDHKQRKRKNDSTRNEHDNNSLGAQVKSRKVTNILPRCVKNDFRANIGYMYINVMNSLNSTLIASFFHHFQAPNFLLTKMTHPNYQNFEANMILPNISLSSMDLCILYHDIWTKLGPDQIFSIKEKKVRHRRDIMKTEVTIDFSFDSVTRRAMTPRKVVECMMSALGSDLSDDKKRSKEFERHRDQDSSSQSDDSSASSDNVLIQIENQSKYLPSYTYTVEDANYIVGNCERLPEDLSFHTDGLMIFRFDELKRLESMLILAKPQDMKRISSEEHSLQEGLS